MKKIIWITIFALLLTACGANGDAHVGIEQDEVSTTSAPALEQKGQELPTPQVAVTPSATEVPTTETPTIETPALEASQEVPEDAEVDSFPPAVENLLRLTDDSEDVHVQLVVGILKLEGSELALTAEQAATLLPLAETLQSINAGEDVQVESYAAVVEEIQVNMSDEQVAAIMAMALTLEDVIETANDLGIQVGPPGGGRPEGGGRPGGGGFEGRPAHVQLPVDLVDYWVGMIAAHLQI